MKRLLCIFSLGLTLARPLQALTFNVSYDPSVTSLTNASEVQAAFAAATQTFQDLYTNPITVNLNVYWGDTGPFSGGVGLGASSTELLTGYGYADVTGALIASKKTPADNSAVASLPAHDPTGSDQWTIPTAEAKALNIPGVDPNDPGSDGDIGFASNQNFTFDPTNRAVAGRYDFIGVAEHEISEVLGRIPGMDTTGIGYVPYDLFRFTANETRSFDENAANVYFSIDDGVTALKFFNPKSNGGDIQDWATSTPPDAFDAYASTGHKLALTTADIVALDIMGYDATVTPAATPPRLTGVKLGNGSFRISFTNTPGASFTALASTNVALASSNWTVLGAVTEVSPGQFRFTDPPAADIRQRFYRVSSP